MKRIQIFIVVLIVLFTLGAISYLILTAAEIQKYAMAISQQKGYVQISHTYVVTLKKLFIYSFKLFLK